MNVAPWIVWWDDGTVTREGEKEDGEEGGKGIRFLGKITDFDPWKVNADSWDYRHRRIRKHLPIEAESDDRSCDAEDVALAKEKWRRFLEWDRPKIWPRSPGQLTFRYGEMKHLKPDR